MAKKIYIAVDFDGTIVKHKYPNIGETIPGAFEYLNKLRQIDGVVLILYTMRDSEELEDAISFCRKNNLWFDYINNNPEFETASKKVYAHIYIDDAAIGCPRLHTADAKRQYVDWARVGPMALESVQRIKDGHYA